VTIIGTTAGIGIALLVVIVVGESCKKYWQQIAIRVVGSWITASAILVFALGLKSAG
jgi:ABC-type cobalamin transport system permease subunit